MENGPEQVVFTVLGLAAVALYIVMVVDGVKVAKQKGRSPHWMWFALHPVGGVIVYICLRGVKPLQRCPRCGTQVPLFVEVCPACRHAFVGSLPERSAVIPAETGTLPGLVTQQISELRRMLDLGLISQEEFDEKKKQILAKM